MKKYKLIAVLAASMAFTTGCYDLDVFPEDQLNSTTFFQTQAHADQAMMGVYSLMTDEDVFGRQFGFDCLGGVGSGYDPASYATIARGPILVAKDLLQTNSRNFMKEFLAPTSSYRM